jgi:hypothetical protein
MLKGIKNIDTAFYIDNLPTKIVFINDRSKTDKLKTIMIVNLINDLLSVR